MVHNMHSELITGMDKAMVCRKSKLLCIIQRTQTAKFVSSNNNKLFNNLLLLLETSISKLMGTYHLHKKSGNSG